MKSNSLFLCFICLYYACTNSTWAQTQDLDVEGLLQQQIEFILENSDQTQVDVASIQSTLLWHLENPLDVNQASFSEWQALGILSDLEILSLLRHKEKHGAFMSYYELQSIDGFNTSLIDGLLPFITLKENETSRFSFNDIKHEIAIGYNQTLQQKQGYIKNDSNVSNYLGSPLGLNLRYFAKNKHIQFGCIAEKDPGEEFFTGSQKQGFDFYSAHLFIKNVGIIKQLAIGDFNLEFGQGLSLWTTRGLNKGSDIYNVKRNGRVLSASRSIDGNFFLRGIAATLQTKKLQTTLFASKNAYDASIENTDELSQSLGEGLLVSSFRTNGYHRTLSEVSKKNTFNDYMFGISPSLQHKKGEIRLLVSHQILEDSVVPSPEIHNLFVEPTYRQSTQLSLSYEHRLNNAILYGEASKNILGGIGWVQGMSISLDPKLSLILHYRHFPKNFISQIPQPIRENSFYNEKGFYSGIEFKLNNKWWITAYVDWFKNIWVSRTVTKPSQGNEYLAQINFKPKRKTLLYVRYRMQQKNRKISDFSFSEENQVQTLQHFRINFDHQIEKKWRLSSRLELSKSLHNNDAFNGYLFYQDLRYKPIQKPFSWVLRLAVFDVQDWDARIYAFEHQTKYMFSIPPYYRKGSRVYFLPTYKANNNLILQAKIGHTLLENENEIGSGNEKIVGNRKTDLNILMRIQF